MEQNKLSRKHFIQMPAVGHGSLLLFPRCTSKKAKEWIGAKESGINNVIDKLLVSSYIQFQERDNHPVIYCMAYHKVYTEEKIVNNSDYFKPVSISIFYQRSSSVSKLNFYDRNEKVYECSDRLPKLILNEGECQDIVSDDHLMCNCTQCHATNGWHKAGTNDDRTPRGAHQGLCCISCHEPLSNDVWTGYPKCHPAISNCKLHVMTMNTTFANFQSPNNIYWLTSNDCHKDQIKTGIRLTDNKRKFL